MPPAAPTGPLGLRLDTPRFNDAVARVIALASSSETRTLVLLRDAHATLAACRSPQVRACADGAAMVLPDGMPLVWLSRLTGTPAERVYGPDLMTAVCAQTALTGTRHLFLGGSAHTALCLRRHLETRHPGLKVLEPLTPDVPHPGDIDARLVNTIEDRKPDILWVGLGAPKQDLWMVANRPHLSVPVMIGVGAAFDFLAGTTPQAPRWMQRSGTEWLFRTFTEPRRLLPRYTRTVPAFSLLAINWLVRRAWSTDR